MPVTRSVSITDEQDRWLEENHISISALVQDMISKLMKERRNR